MSLQGFRCVPARDCWHKSLVPLMEEVRQQMGDGPVYLTFDIDALDPAFAPGTGKSFTAHLRNFPKAMSAGSLVNEMLIARTCNCKLRVILFKKLQNNQYLPFTNRACKVTHNDISSEFAMCIMHMYTHISLFITSKFYLTFKGTPEIAGLTPIQALEIVRGCRGLNLIGGDLVEV